MLIRTPFGAVGYAKHKEFNGFSQVSGSPRAPCRESFLDPTFLDIFRKSEGDLKSFLFLISRDYNFGDYFLDTMMFLYFSKKECRGQNRSLEITNFVISEK